MADTRNRDIEISQYFSVPSGIIDARQEYEPVPEYDFDGEVTGELEPVVVEGEVVAGGPVAPTSFTIVRQRVYIGVDGSSRTDVYVEFPDVQGVSDIEVKVTPV